MRPRTMARQFEVFENPIAAARQIYPLIAVLQSDVADTGRTQMVAPMAVEAAMRLKPAGRLTPIVRIANDAYVVWVHDMVAMRSSDLKRSKGDIGAARDAIKAALDYLFHGI